MSGASTRRRRQWLCNHAPMLLAATVMATGACGDADRPTGTRAMTAEPTHTPQPTTGANVATDCPNRGPSDACRGSLEAGRHTTKLFSPSFSYRVPSGWSNYHDQFNDFLLGPPGVTSDEAQGGSDDYVEVFSDVVGVAASQCAEQAATRARTPGALVGLLRRRPELDVSKPRPARIGGLRGVAVDVRIAPRWKKSCPFPGVTGPVAVVLAGIGSEVIHGVAPRIAMRLYLLKRRPRPVIIEVDDLSGGRHLARYDTIVRSLRFMP